MDPNSVEYLQSVKARILKMQQDAEQAHKDTLAQVDKNYKLMLKKAADLRKEVSGVVLVRRRVLIVGMETARGPH